VLLKLVSVELGGGEGQTRGDNTLDAEGKEKKER